MSTQLIHRSNLVDQVYRSVRKRIIGREFTPGQQLKVEVLSRELGVSSSPIREAFRRLEHDRWVVMIPCRGAFVRAIDETEIKELYEIREILETATLRKVMPRPTPADIDDLSQAADDIQRALDDHDQTAYMAADMHFHEIIVRMANNSRLSQMFTTLAEQGHCFMLGRSREAMNKCEEEANEHQELLKLIRGGKTMQAIRFLQQHLRTSRDELRKLTITNREDTHDG